MTSFDSSPPPAFRPIRIGDLAPDFSARTTQGEKALRDYRGQWLVFFSHPADFTPVCTTEFIGMERASDQFRQMGCALLGLSVDSLYAHHAWLRAIEQTFGVSISFPVVEDPSMAIGRAYGMIDDTADSSAAMRCTYFIDPLGVVRAITVYPHNVGRSVAEMLRLLAALQRADDGAVMTPEGWQPGDDLLHAPDPDAMPDSAADWFCRTMAAP
ncbi:peroxiredoxin [Blastomonas sp. AAP53]|uniref:peroxiredoxin n=1 Tax=Blastomonas sp. AAP53 TaxID=1248760 RepID=UPI00030A8EC0|nr:peroxiredoxin [Blastomonas sp. AAP53]